MKLEILNGNKATKAMGNFAKKAIMLFESNLYSQADQRIENYNGGMWSIGKAGEQLVMFIDSDKQVKATTAYSEIETDMKTASFATFFIVVNMFCHYYHGKDDEMCEYFGKMYHELRNIAFGDDNLLGINQSDFYKITD